MKHKFQKHKFEYTLKRGEFLNIPNFKSDKLYLIKYKSNTGYAYIKFQGVILYIHRNEIIEIKQESFSIIRNTWEDNTEDEVRFDID